MCEPAPVYDEKHPIPFISEEPTLVPTTLGQLLHTALHPCPHLAPKKFLEGSLSGL